MRNDPNNSHRGDKFERDRFNSRERSMGNVDNRPFDSNERRIDNFDRNDREFDINRGQANSELNSSNFWLV